MQVYSSEDTLVQSLKAGEIDFAEGVTPLQVKALQGQDGITAQEGELAWLRRVSPSTPVLSTSTPANRSATPTRLCWTRSSGSP